MVGLLVGWMVGWMIGWLVTCLFGLMYVWFAVRLVEWWYD